MFRYVLFFLVFLLTIWNAYSQAGPTDTWLLEQKLPEWAASAFNAKAKTSYQLSDFINPFYIQSDFNGDSKTDIAIAVVQTGTTKKGILIFHQQQPGHYVIGAGKDFGNGGDNFDWMDIWKVYSANKIGAGVNAPGTVALKTTAIYVAKSESSSAVIYWNGSAYKWHQQGD